MCRVLDKANPHFNPCAHGGADRVWVQHARAELPQLFCVRKAQPLDGPRVRDDERVCGQYARHAFPKLDRAGADRFGEERGREVRAVSS